MWVKFMMTTGSCMCLPPFRVYAGGCPNYADGGAELPHFRADADGCLCRGHLHWPASQDILADDLDGEEDEHNENRRTNDFHAVFHHETGADVVTDHVADGAWDADQEDGLAVQDEDHKGGDVRRQVDHLRLAVGGFDAELREDGEGDDEEGAGTRAVEAIIEADDKCGEDGGHVNFRGIRLRFFDVIVEDVAVQDNEGGHGQDDEEDRDEDLLRDEEADAGTDRGSDDSGDDGRNRELPVDEAFADEADGRDGRAAAAGKLVGADGVMRREAGEQIGRKGNQASASADGVDETGEKNKRTTDKIGKKCDVHSGGTSVCGGDNRVAGGCAGPCPPSAERLRRGNSRAAAWQRLRRGSGAGGNWAAGAAPRQQRTVPAGDAAARQPSAEPSRFWSSALASCADLNNDVHVILFSSQAQVLKSA